MSADHPEAAQTSPNAALDDRGRSPDSSATGREISLGGGMGMGSSLSSSRTTSPSPQSPERRGGGGATLGASLFSFPPSQAPSTGVYSMPMEAFEFRDLDSGRVFSLDERYWIKDVDTGNVYVVQPQDADGAGGAPGQGGVANARGGTGSVGGQMSMRVSDLLSGEELTLEQFEEALGYFKVPPPVPPPLPPPEEDPDMLAAAQHLAQRSLHSLSLAAQASASWIKGKAAAAMGRQSPTRHSDMASWGSGLGPSSPTASSVNMPATDGQGIPVKVSVARKPFKELSDLRLVQQVAAHQGVIWAMRFSRTGRYLATAGQDGVVAVWEVVQRRGESTTPRSATAAAAGASSAGEESQPASPLRGGSTAASSVAGEEEKFGSGSVSPVGSGSGESGSGNATYGVPVLRGRPYRVYHGHKQDILDVAWSKTNFLLSASMDKTVRLWHVSMDDCLRIFK